LIKLKWVIFRQVTLARVLHTGFIRMARPTRRTRSSNIQFRERIPLDI
jgi:hypothetical protein